MLRRPSRSTVRIFSLVLPLSLLLTVSGCGDSKEVPSTSKESAAAKDLSSTDLPATEIVPATQPADPATDEEPVAESATGAIAGVITFEGRIPDPRTIQATKDAEFCSVGEGDVQDVNVKDGKLSGAVIEMTVKGKDLPDFKAPEDGFVLRQKDCRFSPRLLVAYDGAELTVYNDDKVEHNVNTGSWNLLQSPGSDAIKEKIGYQGTPFARVTCNIHSWMESWVYVARSPFYAATSEDGTYTIEGIPAGTKIRGTVMHSVLGKQRFTAEIKAGETTKMDFVFEGK